VTKPRKSIFTKADKAAWKEIFLGPAKGNLKSLEKILRNQGRPVSYQSLFEARKEDEWDNELPSKSASMTPEQG
jgi:hypothetical protein